MGTGSPDLLVTRSRQLIHAVDGVEAAREAFRSDVRNQHLGHTMLSATRYAARKVAAYPKVARSIVYLHSATRGVPHVNYYKYAQLAVQLHGLREAQQ